MTDRYVILLNGPVLYSVNKDDERHAIQLSHIFIYMETVTVKVYHSVAVDRVCGIVHQRLVDRDFIKNRWSV